MHLARNVARNMASKISTRSVFDIIVLYFGYSFRFLSPLILYPLLTRILGVSQFGLYTTAFSLALMISVIVEYGFNLSGTRDIAAAKDAKQRGAIAAKVVLARLLLIPIGISIGVALAISNPAFHNNPTLVGIALLLGCGQGSTAFWYFQGVKKVMTAVILEISGQLVALAAILALVRRPDDVELAIALQALGVCAAAIIGSWMIFREAPASMPRLGEAIDTLTEGFALFLTRASVMIYTSASVFLLGALSSPAQAAFYGVAERVTSAASSLLRPLGSFIMPRVAENLERDRAGAFRLARQALLAVTCAFGVGAAMLAVAAAPLLHFGFGKQFEAGATPLRILALCLPIAASNQILGTNLMVPLRLDRRMLSVLAFGGGVNLALAVILVPAQGAVGMALSRLMTELAITAAFLVCLRPYLPELFPRSAKA